LSIELLLEGLDGVEANETYKYHFERGYGKEYTTDAQSAAAKAAYSAKSGRAARMQQRQQARVLTADEIKKQHDHQQQLLVRSSRVLNTDV
jgi:hypothetical protein